MPCRALCRLTINKRNAAFILPKWHNIRSIADISYYSLVTFKTELLKCFGYPCIFVYTIKVFKNPLFYEKFMNISVKSKDEFLINLIELFIFNSQKLVYTGSRICADYKQLRSSEQVQLVDLFYLLVLMAAEDPSYSTNPQTQNV